MIDAYSILWSDLAALKRRWPRYLLTTLMSPVLYLVAFGWGLGRGINMNGTSYLEFVIPGIIALTSMTTSFNGAGTRLNVDRLYFKSFDECLMAPVGLPSILLGTALIGVVRGILSSVAFLLVAFLIAPAITMLVGSLHRSSRLRGGGLGELFFLMGLGALIFWLYYRIYIVGPESVLPAELHNPIGTPK